MDEMDRKSAVDALAGCLAEERARAEALRRRVAQLEEEAAFMRGQLYGTPGRCCEDGGRD